MTSRSALALVCASMGAAVAAAGCEATIIYIETAAGGAGGGTTSSATTSSSTTSSSMTGGSGGGADCVPGAMRGCYGGPAGTEGQGICEAGSQVCGAEGSWGACVGEVLPKEEDCATPEDEDCDGLAPACKGSLLWAKRFGDVKADWGECVAADAHGHVIIAGHAGSSLDFGGGSTVNVSTGIAFAKLDAAGNHVWSKGFDTTGNGSSCHAVAVDSAGGIFATGTFSGSIDFGGGPLVASSAPSYSMFVVKLDSSGNHVWSSVFGPGAYGASIAVNTTGDVVLGGWVSSAVDFGAGILPSAGGNDVFVAAFDGNGKHRWSKLFGDSADQTGVFALTALDEVVIAGSFQGSIDFGGGVMASTGNSDMFAAKLDRDGNHIWSQHWGNVGADIGAAGIAVDGGGHVLLTGILAGSVDFGDELLMSKTSNDVFAAKLDSNGMPAWGTSFGATSVQNAYAIAADGGGNVLLTGNITGVVDFGGGQIVSAGGADAFITKLDGGGGFVWARRAGDVAAQTGTGVTVDPAGNVLITGYLSGSMDFGGAALTSIGGTDIFVAKFSP